MGIIDKLATGPFWRFLEQDGSILDLNPDLLQFLITLTQWSQGGNIPFRGEPMFS